MSDASRLKSTLYVSNLALEVTTSTLESAFVPFGDIAGVTLPKPELASNADPHRGFGYVEFEDAADAREALDNMDQSELFGRVIKVAQARPQRSAEEGLGSKTAVWEQVGFPLFAISSARVLICCRRDGWRSMRSVRRTGRRHRATRMAMRRRWSRCKGWRAWTWPGQSRHDGSGRAGDEVANSILCLDSWRPTRDTPEMYILIFAELPHVGTMETG
ncbi:MAG: RNA recognition motif domain-containing protein [Terriglobus roseus]|nr:RNA recognition motif domain-containing protein [Terriglobus roseus]